MSLKSRRLAELPNAPREILRRILELKRLDLAETAAYFSLRQAHILQGTIKSVSPKARTRRGIDELARYPVR
jgi:hypothetical protein